MSSLAVTAAALLMSGAASVFANEPLVRSITPARVPLVTVARLKLDVDNPHVAARRLETALLARLKPIEARFREDTRLRRVGTVIGLGAVAVGALRGEQPLVAVGTGVLRLGFSHQISEIQRTTGFSVSPTLERHGFSISLTKRFP